MNRARRPPLSHPLAPVFDRAVESLCAALSPDTARHYRGTVRNFLSHLGAAHPSLTPSCNCAGSLTSLAGCPACARKRRPL